MKEKILSAKPKGMLALCLIVAALLLSIVGLILGVIILESVSVYGIVLAIFCALVLLLGWIPLIGLKILKPQEALVLTLFGKYVGTLKGDGFFFVNPFCTAFNPAAGTKLGQSGDVTSKGAVITAAAAASRSASVVTASSTSLEARIVTLAGRPT